MFPSDESVRNELSGSASLTKRLHESVFSCDGSAPMTRERPGTEVRKLAKFSFPARALFY